MSVEKQGLWQVSFDLCEYKRRKPFIFDDLASQSFDVQLVQPSLDMKSSFLKLSIGLPLSIIASGEIVNSNVLHE